MAINSQWGLTATGFYVPTFQELLSSIEDDFIQSFGDNIPLTSNSNLGILARQFAGRDRANWEQNQLVYYSAFISTAQGAALDYIGGNLGVARKTDKPATAQITVTTKEEFLLQAGERFETEDGYEFTLLRDLLTTKQSDGTYKGTEWVQCEETGKDTNVPAGSITIESDPTDEVISVTNLQAAGDGQDYEDDETYRERLRMENAARPGSTHPGIRSALMNLSGVRQVDIVENPTESVDKYGNVPESFHVYVLGGNKEDIAETLVDYIAAGTTMNGKQVLNPLDATGNHREIKFDFATEKPIYVKVDINTDESWNMDDGLENVKQAVVDYISDLKMGQKVYVTKLYPSVYSIEGISDARIQIGTDPAKVADADIFNERYEVPTCQIENVEVNLNGLRNN